MSAAEKEKAEAIVSQYAAAVGGTTDPNARGQVGQVVIIYEDQQASKDLPYGWGWRQLQVVLLFLALSMAYCFRINMSVCIVEMTDSKSSSGYKTYDWASSEKQLILSSFFWGYICTQIPAGILAVKYGPKWFLFFGIVACSVLSATTSLAAEWGGWKLVVAWRVAQGVVQGFIYPSSHAMLSRWSPPVERGRHTAIVYNGISVGTVVSMAGSGALAASSLGWPSAFWVPGVIGLAWGVAWALLAADSPATCSRMHPDERRYIEEALGDTSSKEERLPVPWKSIFTSLPMWALIIVHMGQNFGHWVLLTEMPTYMKEVLGKNIEDNGLLSSLPYITLTFTSIFVGWFGQVVNTQGWLSHNVSRKGFQSLAHWGSGTTMLLLGLFDVSQTMAVVLLCVAVGFEAGTLVGYLCNHMDMSPNFGGAMMGVTNCLAAIVAIIAPILVGLITGNDDGKLTQEEVTSRWSMVFLLAAAVYYLGNLFWVIFGSTQVQPWNYPKTHASTEEPSAPSAVVDGEDPVEKPDK